MVSSRALLLINSFGFMVFGFLFLYWPKEAAYWVGIHVDSSSGLGDIRATYGGLQIGLGLYLLFCSLFPPARLAGFLAATLAFGGLMIGRLAGILFDGMPDKISFGLLAVEATGLLMNFAFLITSKGRERD